MGSGGCLPVLLGKPLHSFLKLWPEVSDQTLGRREASYEPELQIPKALGSQCHPP